MLTSGEVSTAEDRGRGKLCSAGLADKSSDFFLLEAKTRLKPIPPDTAALNEETEGPGLLDLLWLEPMSWDGTCVVFLRG